MEETQKVLVVSWDCQENVGQISWLILRKEVAFLYCEKYFEDVGDVGISARVKGDSQLHPRDGAAPFSATSRTGQDRVHRTGLSGSESPQVNPDNFPPVLFEEKGRAPER